MKHQLEQKLWTLWGDLPEHKAQEGWNEDIKPSNHPFECCLEEYGVWEGEDEENGEWKRVLRLKQTVIRD